MRCGREAVHNEPGGAGGRGSQAWMIATTIVAAAFGAASAAVFATGGDPGDRFAAEGPKGYDNFGGALAYRGWK